MRYWIRDKIDHLVSYVYTHRLFGPRCPEVNPDCACCKAWILHDELFNHSKPGGGTSYHFPID